MIWRVLAVTLRGPRRRPCGAPAPALRPVPALRLAAQPTARRWLCTGAGAGTLAGASAPAGAAWWRRPLRLAWVVTRNSYLALALIPTSFTVAAWYHHVVGHPEQVSRAHLFFAWTGFLCLPLSVALLAVAPAAYALEGVTGGASMGALDAIQRAWARWTCWPLFFRPEIEGAEIVAALHARGEAVVFVSNHKSWADIYSLLWLPVPIKFVSKQQIYYIPVVGWSMGLLGHVSVPSRADRARDRSDAASPAKSAGVGAGAAFGPGAGAGLGSGASSGSGSPVVDTCVKRLQGGSSIYIFAEGTRSRDGYVQPFKQGAFVIAKRSGCRIVPISISGTGRLMPPNRGETWLEDGAHAPVTLVVHEPIDPRDFDSIEALQERTRELIESRIMSY
jgi:1-acyl-sn-glycerol-3-phosphate acyltransferase